MKSAVVAAMVLAAVPSCIDDTEPFLFVTSAGVSAREIDVSCDCDLDVFDDGACEQGSEGQRCGCGATRTGRLEAVRDGVVVATSDDAQLRGDFAGAQVRIYAGGEIHVVDVPDAFPPGPHVVYAADGLISWRLDRPVPVELSYFAGVNGLASCRVGANQSPIHTQYYAGLLGRVLAEEEVPSQAGVRIVMVTGSDDQRPPPMPLPGIPTPDPKHLRAP